MSSEAAVLPPRRSLRLSRVRRPPVVVGVLLLLISFLQSPGQLTFDTKLDLVIDPAGFLGRALHLWDPQGAFGQLQNQAFGYFFPLGPFFLLSDLASVPPWIAQRLWSGLLLVVAFEGVRRLAKAVLDVSGPVALVGGLAYALSPRMVSTVGSISAEALVVALVPWTLLPLLAADRTGVRRAAALSAIAVLLMGGANATLVLAVLPAPALWILLRSGPRLRLFRWWCGCVLLAVLWWLLPLLLLGRYSPPFLGWVESSANTTGPMGVSAVLRGVTHWVAYVAGSSGPFWPGAARLVTEPLLVLATGGLAVLGMTGLALRGLPHRRPLLAVAAVGLLGLATGFGGTVGPPLSDTVRELLDGPLAPFRNVHKFDPLVRLPLVLGATYALSRLTTSRGRWTSVRRWSPALVLVLVLVAALPLLQGQSRPGPAFDALPSWWHEAAATTADTPGRTLVVPGAGSARQSWGRTVDEPLQPLAEGPWAVRSQVPLGGAGSTRLMDAVEEVLAAGQGSDGLAGLLARSGISQLLVRYDLDVASADGLSPVLVRAALARSPGLRLGTSFGPSAVPDGDRRSGRAQPRPQIEQWLVDPLVEGAADTGAGAARAVAADDVPVVTGGPESVLPLLEAGLLDPSTPVVLAGEPDPLPGASWGLLTDGLRYRERSFGRIHDALGPVLPVDTPFTQDRAVHDLLPFEADGHQTAARYDGIEDVRASSSAAGLAGFGPTDPSAVPFAAVDGNPATAWRSSASSRAEGQWLEVQVKDPLALSSLTLELAVDPTRGPGPSRVRVDTDSGGSEHPLVDTREPQLLQLPAGTVTRTVRLTVVEARAGGAGQVGIGELRFPGVVAFRTLAVPDDQPVGASPAGAAFGMRPVARGPCVRVDDGTDCDDGLLATADEGTVLDRTFSLVADTELRLRGSVTARPGGGAARLLEPLAGAPSVTASSSWGGSLSVGARAALDGRSDTAWVADRLDLAPSLALSLPSPRSLTTVQVVPASAPRSSAPRTVVLVSAAGERRVVLDAEGRGRFPALVTDRLVVSFPEVDLERTPRGTSLPVGVAELRLDGVEPYAAPADAATGALCGFGPELSVDGVPIPTRVVGSTGALQEDRPLALEACGGPVTLAAGEHRVQVVANADFHPRSVVLVSAAAPSVPPTARQVDTTSWDETARTLQVAPGPAAVLVVPENANDGWAAELDGTTLARTVVDGWQQAWLVPAGDGGTVRLVFAPDGTYRAGLLLGALAALVLVALSLGRRGAAAASTSVPPGADRAVTRAGRRLGAMAVVVLGAALGGPAGAAVAVVTVLLVRRWRRPALLAAVATAATTAVVVVGALEGDAIGAARGPLSQLLGLAAVAAVASAPLARAGSADRTVRDQPSLIRKYRVVIQ